MSGQAQPWERRKPYATVAGFAKARLRTSEHDSTHTGLSCLYAHYRRWSFMADMLALSSQRFEADLRKLCKSEPEEFRGDVIFPIEIVLPGDPGFEATPQKRPTKTKPKVQVLGQVKFTRRVDFGTGKNAEFIPAGEVLDWVVPDDEEKETISSKANDRFARATDHIVVMFRDKRRIVATSGLRRKL